MIFNVFRPKTKNTLSPTQLESLISGANPSSTGVPVSPETASRFGTVFACVRVRAESLGQLPLHLYEQVGRMKQKATDNPLYTLLHDAPNETMTAQEFWEWVSASLDLRGNAYVFINRVKGGKIFELLPLDARWVTVNPAMQSIGQPITYTLTVTNTPKVIYGPDQILHFKLMSLDGGRTGASVIEQARNTIGLGMALEAHGSTFFKNGASPSGILKTEQVLDEETYNGIRDSWYEAHGGINNMQRVAILEAGLSWQSVGMSLSDAQFLEGRKYQRSEICGLFRVPPHMIGDLEHATFSNIEQQSLDFVIHGLMPLLTRIEQRIKLQLISLADRYRFFAKFNVNQLVRGDMAARANFYTSMVQNGAMSPNEIRDLEDQNPREGGDIYLTPLNMAVNGKPPSTEEGT